MGLTLRNHKKVCPSAEDFITVKYTSFETTKVVKKKRCQGGFFGCATGKSDEWGRQGWGSGWRAKDKVSKSGRRGERDKGGHTPSAAVINPSIRAPPCAFYSPPALHSGASHTQFPLTHLRHTNEPSLSPSLFKINSRATKLGNLKLL